MYIPADDDFDKERFKTAVLQVMKYRKITGTKLAELSGITGSSLSRFLQQDKLLLAEAYGRIANALGASDFKALYALGEQLENEHNAMSADAAQQDPLDVDRFRIAILYLMESRGMSQNDLSKKSGVSGSQLSIFLNDTRELKLTPEICQALKEAFGAKTYQKIYDMAENAAQKVTPREECDDKDFLNAVSSILVSKAMTYTKLSEESGVNYSQISSSFSGTNRVNMSYESRVKIRNALGASSFAKLIEIGKKSAYENPFDEERFFTALKNILKESHMPIASFARQMDMYPSRMNGIIHRKIDVSLDLCFQMMHALGAKNLRQFYLMGNVPLPGPDNGIGEVVSSLISSSRERMGKVNETQTGISANSL